MIDGLVSGEIVRTRTEIEVLSYISACERVRKNCKS
jgi:hypothetical protein